ncbi:hypothetical protein P8452_64538 [Trifolium repens]|nr:hypothetical protein P8452_64538 [Trifolium repens]
MHAKCADFGLSRAFDNNADSHISMRPAGTFGYADPRTILLCNSENTNILKWIERLNIAVDAAHEIGIVPQ